MNEANTEASVQGWRVPIDTPIYALFEWCAQAKGVDRLLLSARLKKDSKEPILLEPKIESTMTSVFGEKVLARKLARRWPGTELIGHSGMVYEVAFDPSVIAPMARLGPRLKDWQMSGSPPLPEDPCLFSHSADWPVLVSVTHEADAWILSEERPPFCTEDPFLFRPEYLLVPPATTGFVAD